MERFLKALHLSPGHGPDDQETPRVCTGMRRSEHQTGPHGTSVPFKWLICAVGCLVGAHSIAAADDIFVDRAAESGLDFEYFNGMSGALYFSEHMGGGAALLDYDGDGDLDVYAVQGRMLGAGKTRADSLLPVRYPEPLTDRLYRNDSTVGPDGAATIRFVDVTERAGLAATEYGVGVTSADFDNDGWPDLYITNFGPNTLLRNNGDGTFSDVSRASQTAELRWGASAAFADVDNDGWLDIYVGNYVNYRIPTDKPCASQTGARDYCGPLAYKPEPDRLYRNRGDGTFEDVSTRSGIESDFGAALGVISADFDDDGWLDIYVANDQLPNQLWQNQGDGTFVDIALLAGAAVNAVGQPEASMGVVAGDIDDNGTEDLFMAHLAQETNTLYLNDGDAFFRDATKKSGLGMTSFAFTGFGTALFDYDLDGQLDLFVANGAVKRLPDQLEAGDPLPLRQRNQLFRNQGGGDFREVEPDGQSFLIELDVSRGASTGDLDNDGDPDLVVINNGGPTDLGMNEGPIGAWIGLDLRTADGRAALGSKVTARLVSGKTQWRRVRTDGSYASANDARVTFGLAAGGELESARIDWLGGGATEWRNLPGGRYYVGQQRLAEAP